MTTDILLGLIDIEVADKVCSKVEGRRNYVIRIQSKAKIIDFAGGYGQADRWHLLGAYLWEIGEYGINWFEFTYKKDYLKALEILKNKGYKER